MTWILRRNDTPARLEEIKKQLAAGKVVRCVNPLGVKHIDTWNLDDMEDFTACWISPGLITRYVAIELYEITFISAEQAAAERKAREP